MVELVLNSLDDDLLPHCYVAMRVGESQKIGRVSAERTYKFPETTVGEHKYAMLDVFQRVGGCTVSIKQKDGDQDVQLTTKMGKLKFRVAHSQESKKKAQKVPLQDTALKPKFEVAKAYLAKHNLEARLRDAMKAVINELPDDPIDFITQTLRKSDSDAVFQVASDRPEAVPLRQDAESVEMRARAEALLEVRARAHQALLFAAADGRLHAGLDKVFPNHSAIGELQNDDRQAFLDASQTGGYPNNVESAYPPPYQPKGVVDPGRQPDMTRSLSQLISPPEFLLEEQIYEFKAEIREFKDDLTKEQVMRFQAVFSTFEDKENRITKDSLYEVIKIAGQDTITDWEIFQDVMLDIPDSETFTFPEVLSVVVETKKEDEEDEEDEDAEEFYHDLSELLEAFSLLDPTGSGFVDAATLVKATTGQGYSRTRLVSMVVQTGTSNGKVKYADFARLMVATPPDGEKEDEANNAREFNELLETFRFLDPTGSGYVESARLMKATSGQGNRLASMILQTGNDGRIKYADFVKLMMARPPSV
jgi:Ca2+-binding EF-hand superfamily protein